VDKIAFARSIALAASSNSDRIWVASVPSIVFDSLQQIAETTFDRLDFVSPPEQIKNNLASI
jgi:hypothetical protein